MFFYEQTNICQENPSTSRVGNEEKISKKRNVYINNTSTISSLNKELNIKNFEELQREDNGKETGNENVLLQLAVPSSGNNKNCFFVNSTDDSSENQSRPNSTVNYSISELDNCERKTESSSSNPAEEDHATPIEEKKIFSDLLTKTLSLFYALFNVTLGLAVYVTDIVDGSRPIAETFSLLLVVVAFIYIVFLVIDLTFFVKKKNRFEKLLERNAPQHNIDIKEIPNGNHHNIMNLQEILKLKKSLKHHYCFSEDRHSTNFYIKVGAAAFCFGHLIHSGLLLGYQLVFLTAFEIKFYECVSLVTLVLDFVYPLYSFLLLFFIFKYSNVIINRHLVLARFGIMHCLSSSLCFWFWTILRETIEALAKNKHKNNDNDDNDDDDNNTADLYSKKENIQIELRKFTVACDPSHHEVRVIYSNFSPYLYPFSVEYSILVVGVLYLVWRNIGMCGAENQRHLAGNKDNMESNIVIHADCHSSNKGLFGGFIILVLTIVSVILFFIAIYNGDEDWSKLGLTINAITSLTILTLMTIACLCALRQITKLDFNTLHHHLLDDILLFICISAYFLNGIFSIIPAIIHGNMLNIISICFEVVQVLLQTVLILDGLRRSSNTSFLRKKKPGREMVTFLVVANVALWLMQTFEVKYHDLQDDRYDFYGKEMWTILGHMCLPLMMFYRFHSSVCLGDIWKHSYEKSLRH